MKLIVFTMCAILIIASMAMAQLERNPNLVDGSYGWWGDKDSYGSSVVYDEVPSNNLSFTFNIVPDDENKHQWSWGYIQTGWYGWVNGFGCGSNISAIDITYSSNKSIVFMITGIAGHFRVTLPAANDKDTTLDLSVFKADANNTLSIGTSNIRAVVIQPISEGITKGTITKLVARDVIINKGNINIGRDYNPCEPCEQLNAGLVKANAKLITDTLRLFNTNTNLVTANVKSLDSIEVLLDSIDMLLSKLDLATPVTQILKSDNRYGIRFTQNIVSDKAEISVVLPNNERVVETKFVIYDMTGNVVFENNAIGSDVSWNLTNGAGRFVANGTYLVIAEVKGPNGKVYAYSARLGVKR